MARVMGKGGLRPSRASSALAAAVGIGLLIVAGLFLFSPLAGGAAFITLWIAVLVAIVAFHLVNALGDRGPDHATFHFRTEHLPRVRNEDNFGERLRELENLRHDGLLSDEEYRQKRSEIIQSRS